MKRLRENDGQVPWGALPQELVQDIFSFLSHDLGSASLACRAWRTAACAMVTHLTLPLNHPLLVAGPAPGWAELVARMTSQQGILRERITTGDQSEHTTPTGNVAVSSSLGTSARPNSGVSHWLRDGEVVTAGPSSVGAGAGGSAPSPSTPGGLRIMFPPGAVDVSPLTAAPRRGTPLPRLRTQFPWISHITLIHNAMLHRAQVHAAISTLRTLWPTVLGMSVHDSVTWDLPLDYSALGVMTHITSLELLFQGQGGMDEAGQPMYRSSMPHLCKLGQLKELCMKWIIGYDVDSFLDFSEVYDLLASLVRHNQLRSLQFGGENINAEGARYLASITTLETLHLVCDARPASPLHLLDLLSMPRLARLELMHVCPDHAWNSVSESGDDRDPLVELSRRTAALSVSPLRCLALSLSPGCRTLMSRALPLLPNLHSLAVRVTSTNEEEALCDAFRAMRCGVVRSAPPPPQPGQQLQPPEQAAAQYLQRQQQSAVGSPSPVAVAPGLLPPPLRALRVETAELGSDLVSSIASLTALTSLQLPRGLPSGETVVYDAAAAAAAGAGAAAPPPLSACKYTLSQLSALGRLSCLRQLMIQMDSPADTAPAFVDGSLLSVLSGLTDLESLHLSSWNLLGADPTKEALGAFPERQLDSRALSQSVANHRRHLRLVVDQLLPTPWEIGDAGPSGTWMDVGVTRASTATEAALEPAGRATEAGVDVSPAAADGGQNIADVSSSGSGAAGGCGGGENLRRAAHAESRALTHRGLMIPSQTVSCLPTLPTWAWRGLRSLSLSHWPCLYGKLREAGLPQPGRCYAVRWDDLPESLEALLLVRCQLVGTRPPPRLRHMWLGDCFGNQGIYTPILQALRQLPDLETLVLRWPSAPDEPEAALESTLEQRAELVGAVAAIRGLRTLGLGGISCQDVTSLAPLPLLRHLMLEPAQPPRPVHDVPGSQRDLSLLDHLMTLPPGALSGLRTLWLPNWAMPIKQLLQWQQMLQAAMPLVVLRVTEYDVVWTVPTPVMHVAQVEAPSSLAMGRGDGGAAAASAGNPASGRGEQRSGWGSWRKSLHAGRGLDGQELEWWHIGCWSVQ
ncbi:hypothetical protein VaNZ11_004770 [Volvox africanus]|uniref:F-box domain-containing protein n=1 Tax=Volvox africanus TaxID=51714 RepID=A0ABQ5RX72_9CHLO|nr:hypothetical protein VaNZ11_004770 [Volvox africanus]